MLTCFQRLIVACQTTLNHLLMEILMGMRVQEKAARGHSRVTRATPFLARRLLLAIHLKIGKALCQIVVSIFWI